jgi:hypothetical protein
MTDWLDSELDISQSSGSNAHVGSDFFQQKLTDVAGTAINQLDYSQIAVDGHQRPKKVAFCKGYC